MSRKHYISVLSVISTVAVVYLHTNGCFWQFSKERYWATANIIESVFYFAVPVFFMISGATLLDYQEKYDTKEFFFRRLKKTVIPFMFWSLLGLIYQIYKGRIQIEEQSIIMLFNDFINGNIINIYWYFPALFNVYLSIPLLAAVPKEKRKSIYRLIIALAFMINSIIPFINSVFNLNIDFPLNVIAGSGYLLYVLVGYYISEYVQANDSAYIYIY